MKEKTINSQVLAEAGCFLLFGVAMLYLLISERYLDYVTPRIAPYLLFTAVVMVVWAAAGLKGLFRVRHRRRAGHCFVLLLPVVLLLLPHGTVGTADLSGSAGLLTGSAIGSPSGIMGAARPNQEAPAPGEETGVAQVPPGSEPAAVEKGTEQEEAATDTYMSMNVYGQPMALHGYDEINRSITVSNEEFYDWMSEFFMNPQQLEGFRVTVTGAVYKDAAVLAENEFVPARLVMSCCVADLAPCGLVCRYDKAAELAPDAWVTVTGTLHRGQYQGQEELQLQVENIVPAEPVKGYIFPYL